MSDMKKYLMLAVGLMAAAEMFAAPGECAKIFDKLLYGTQYYRAPTPLPEEWETDLAALEGFNLDTIQIRVNWRQNERQEDVYTFDDVDRLMDIAEKHGRRVVIKFLLECAPQYIFEKYAGTRIGPKGELIRGASHGAFYTGGWLPCFTNPKVAERAAKFVRTFAARYVGRKNLIFWSAWNEPRNKPVEECFCPECRKAFAAHMQKRFGTIEKLNEFYGVAEDSFDTLALPAMAHGYWDAFEFKRFKSSDCIYNNLKNVYDAIRSVDPKRPIISHIGYTSGFQCSLCDICDDFTVSKAVDGWGTSLPMSTCMETRDNRIEYGRLNDFLRSVSPNYFVYEIYPGLGMFNEKSYDTEWDMTYKLYDALAIGAKGMFFWQYRSERVGHENDCAGLARMDGSPRPVLNSVREYGATIRQFNEKILDFYETPADVAIVFDYRSQLMSEVEDACGGLYSFADKPDAVRYYPMAHRGFYHLMRKNDVRVDYLGVKNIGDIFKYKVVYFPQYAMLDRAIVPTLVKFVSEGGTIIADEGFGMRLANTWMNPYDLECPELIKARLVERRRARKALKFGGRTLNTCGYYTEYRSEGTAAALEFADGIAAAHEVRIGKGKMVLLGFSLGYSALVDGSPAWMDVFTALTKGADLQKTAYGRVAEDLEERRLVNGNEQYVFLINSSKAEKRVELKEKVLATYGQGAVSGKTAVIPARSALILLCER